MAIVMKKPREAGLFRNYIGEDASRRRAGIALAPILSSPGDSRAVSLMPSAYKTRSLPRRPARAAGPTDPQPRTQRRGGSVCRSQHCRYIRTCCDSNANANDCQYHYV